MERERSKLSTQTPWPCFQSTRIRNEPLLLCFIQIQYSQIDSDLLISVYEQVCLVFTRPVRRQDLSGSQGLA